MTTQWHDPFARCAPGAVADLGLSRTDRVAMLGRAAQALLDGKLPDDASRLFLAGGLVSWLQQGGSLTKDYWRVCGPQGSNHTEAVIWRQLSASRSATHDEDAHKLDLSSTALEGKNEHDTSQ